MTLTEKILARAAGKAKVQAGDNIWVNADVLMTSARIAAEIGLIGTPIFGSAKNNSSSNVTSGVAREMLT